MTDTRKRADPIVRPTPGLVLATMLALLATQVVRLLLGGRGRYPVTLGVSVAAVAAGEAVAAAGPSGPTLGDLHVVLDLVALLTAHTLAVLLLPGKPPPHDREVR